MGHCTSCALHLCLIASLHLTKGILLEENSVFCIFFQHLRYEKDRQVAGGGGVGAKSQYEGQANDNPAAGASVLSLVHGASGFTVSGPQPSVSR